MNNKKLPSLSIVIVNKNGGAKLEQALKTIDSQDYPKELIEILLIDGGSTDSSKDLAAKYGANFINGGFSDNQEARRHVGIQNAKNEIIVSIDSDNYMPETNWLQKMVAPLMEDKEIFASQTLYYDYRKFDRYLSRYFSLFGVNDPVAFYLNKADRMAHYNQEWSLAGMAVDKKSYYKVTFDKEMPTVGCNGFLIRRDVINSVLTVPENFFHIDIIYDLVCSGHRNIAFVKTSIVHDTSDNLFHLLKKRFVYFAEHSVKLESKRRYKVFDPSLRTDKRNLLKFVFYSVTLVKPTYDAIKGFLKKPDLAWFAHPVVCLAFLGTYGYATFLKTTKSWSRA